MSLGKLNKVNFSLNAYPYYLIMGEPKVGKTTFMYDLNMKLHNDPRTLLLINCGNEEGYHSIENLNVQVAYEWDKEYGEGDSDLPEEEWTQGLIQTVNELVETRKTNGIKIVAIDTLDELVEIATKQVYVEHFKEKGKYCKSLNDALGGFGSGRNRLIDLINEQLVKLYKAGYAVFVIAHIKKKAIEDILTGEKYEKITNNMNNDIFNSIKNKAQMVVNICIENKVEGYQEKTGDKPSQKEVAGRLIGTKRVMYFRDNGLVDAGTRFSDLPEKLDFSVDNFLYAFEYGCKSGCRETQATPEQIEEKKKQEEKVIELKADKIAKEESSVIKENILNKTKELIKLFKPPYTELLNNYITQKGIKSLLDLDVPSLQEVYIDILNLSKKIN